MRQHAAFEVARQSRRESFKTRCPGEGPSIRHTAPHIGGVSPNDRDFLIADIENV
jgi:hypothetical protein